MTKYAEAGKELRQLREKAGIKQAEFSRKLGLKNVQEVSNWERGTALVPVLRAAEYSKALGVDLKVMRDIYLRNYARNLDRLLSLGANRTSKKKKAKKK